MPEKCTDNPRDCPLIPRLEALEESNRNHSRVHEGMYDRLRALEKENAVQNTNWTNVNGKLDSLTTMVQSLTNKINEVEHKPAKRWEGLSDKVIWFIVEAILIVAAVKVGLR